MEEDWETLRTYSAVLAELNGRGDVVEGQNPLIQQAQLYGS